MTDKELSYALQILSDAADRELQADGETARYPALMEAIGRLKGARYTWVVVFRYPFDDVPLKTFYNEAMARGFASTVPAGGEWETNALESLGLQDIAGSADCVYLYRLGPAGLESAELIREF